MARQIARLQSPLKAVQIRDREGPSPPQRLPCATSDESSGKNTIYKPASDVVCCGVCLLCLGHDFMRGLRSEQSTLVVLEGIPKAAKTRRQRLYCQSTAGCQLPGLSLRKPCRNSAHEVIEDQNRNISDFIGHRTSYHLSHAEPGSREVKGFYLRCAVSWEIWSS